MWKTKSLKDLCSIFTDGDWIEKKDQSIDGIRLLQTGNIKVGYFAERQDKARYISEDTFNRLNCTEVKRGDILVSRLPDPVGRASIIPELKDKAITAVDCTIIRLKEEILPTYLNYYMQSPQYLSLIQLKVTGATRQRISRKNLGEIPITFPPLAEQERIVAKLDAAFAKIDKVVAVTTKNIETIEFLFQKSLDKIFRNPSLKFIELDEACSILGGGTPSKKNKSFYVGKVPWATVRDMKNDYISNTEFKITNDAIKKSSTNVIPSGNVVIATRVGLGKVCIVKEDTAINQDLKGIIPKNTELLDTDFLFFWFKSISKIIINAGTGATVQGVKLPFIKSLKIPDIDITSQKKLASNAKFISEQSELLARIYNKKLNDLAVLKASILKQELQSSEAA